MHGVEHKKNTLLLGNVHTTKHLPWKSNNYYFLVCVCVHARAFVRACMWVLGHVGAFMHVSTCSLANPASNVQAPYCDVMCVSRFIP
jgi:hypothetical protein